MAAVFVGEADEEEEVELMPTGVTQSLGRVEYELGQLENEVQTFLRFCNRDTLSLLSSLERACTFLSLSKTVNTLFCLHLRSKGESLNEHPANSEVERVGLYEDKIGHFMDRIEAPKCPTSVLDVQAANRFIEHAIPDLTKDQKKGIREISKTAAGQSNQLNDGTRISSKRIRNKLVRTQSVTEAAATFLEEARKELLEAQREGKGGIEKRESLWEGLSD